MLLVLKASPEEVGREAARLVANAVRRNPALRLGLATGSTTVGMYQELVRLHRQESLDFSRVFTFNLDEYLGLSADHPQSFAYFMRQNFFSHVNIPPLTFIFRMAPSKTIFASTALRTNRAFAMLGASTCKSWASAATATWASTSLRPALARPRGLKFLP